MERNDVCHALLATALLAPAADITPAERSLLISRVPSFDIDSLDDSAEAILHTASLIGIRQPSHRLFRLAAFKKARLLAAEWSRNGVFVVRGERIGTKDADMHRVPAALFGFGQEDLLNGKIAAIVSSRRPRRLKPGDLWVDVVKAFFNEASAAGFTIVSSCGTLGYDLVTRLAGRSNTPLVAVCDDLLPFMWSAAKQAERLDAWKGRFPRDRVLFLSSFAPGCRQSPAERSQERDRLALSLASRIFVAAVRSGGTMESRLQEAVSRRVVITVLTQDHSNAIESGTDALVQRIIRGVATVETRPASTIALSIPQIPDASCAAASRNVLMLEEWPQEGSVLVHYTRSCPGPWPGQSHTDYLDSILDGSPSAGHSGFDTLVRILEEGRIRACGRMVRNGLPVVSLTECPPGEVRGLVQWRKALIRWSFEPYGIAMDRECLSNLGAQRVIYGGPEVFATLSEEQRHLFQLNTPEGPGWTVEKEWRTFGDLHLKSVPREKLTAIVSELDEARIIVERFGCRVTLASYRDSRK